MKKVIIYDLDYTLFNPKTLGRDIFQPVFDILKDNECLMKYNFSELENDFFSVSLNEFIKKYISKDLKEDFVTSLRKIKFPLKLETYNDSYVVPKFNTKNYLVTSGFREFQNQK